MNKRNREILRGLVQESRSVTLGELAEDWNVSERTIRNDIAELNEYLENKGIAKIEIQKSGTVQIMGNVGEVHQLDIEKDLYSYRLSKEERMQIFTYALLTASPAVTLGTLAELLQVSRATITHAVEPVKEKLSQWQLEVVPYSNKGLCVKGKESDKRRALYDLLMEMVNFYQINDIRFPNYPAMNINEQIQPERRRAICRMINEQEHLHETFFLDSSFVKLQCYLIVAMLRNTAGMLLEHQDHEVATRMGFARELLQYISRYCDLTMSEDEARALSMFLEGLQYTKKKADISIIRTQMVTRRFIAAISRTLHIPLTTDLGFYEDLSNHLVSIFKKASLDSAPSVDEIVDQHPQVYEAVLQHKHILERACGRDMKEMELKYIVIHICVALERITNRQREPRIILVCGSGNVTSRLLYEKLSRTLRIAAIFSSHDMESIENCGADMIISTVPLRDCSIESVQVSAMLTQEDTVRILSKLEELRKRWNKILHTEESVRKSPHRLIREVQKIVRQETGKQDSPLSRKLAGVLAEYFNLEEKPEETKPLHELLPAERIRLDVECGDWRRAVQLVAKPLLESGYIEASYVEKIFEIIEEKGAYMIMAKGLIVLHAGLLDGAQRMGFSMLRLQKGIDFGKEDYQKGVRFVCCLSPVNPTGHLQALMTLTNLFSDKEFSGRMEKADSVEEIQEIILDYEAHENELSSAQPVN